MKTKAEKEFDKWIREFVGIQDEYLFQKGTLVRTVAIKYAEFIASQPSDVSDEDIRTQAGNESRRLTANSPYRSGFYDGYEYGAKAMRDGQIKPTIEGENEELCNCSDGGKYLDGYYDTHCDRCKKHLR